MWYATGMDVVCDGKWNRMERSRREKVRDGKWYCAVHDWKESGS
jgi:hypothetical protein